MKYFKITLKKAQNDLNGMLSPEIVSRCYFCQKRCKIDSLSFKNLHRISGFKEFFCGFCVRNGFNTRCNRDVLILNFKNVFSYYYAQNYLNLKNMWISEIKDLVQIHVKVGLKNPVFCYDEESMYWFINFAKVGETKRQINIEEVYKTIISIMNCLNISQIISRAEEELLKQKYFDAIDLFSKKRYRPKNKKVLSPRIGNFREEINFQNFD
jgi:hypothetical protein